MDMQTFTDNYIKNMRAARMIDSPQLTLGQLTERVESILEQWKASGEGDEPCVYFDFGSLVPTNFDSWRGSYAELALGYALDDDKEGPTLSDFLKLCKETDGATFGGWKGGDYTMNKNTPVWVANQGHSGDTGIVEVLDDGWRVILATSVCEY